MQTFTKIELSVFTSAELLRTANKLETTLKLKNVKRFATKAKAIGKILKLQEMLPQQPHLINKTISEQEGKVEHSNVKTISKQQEIAKKQLVKAESSLFSLDDVIEQLSHVKHFSVKKGTRYVTLKNIIEEVGGYIYVSKKGLKLSIEGNKNRRYLELLDINFSSTVVIKKGVSATCLFNISIEQIIEIFN